MRAQSPASRVQSSLYSLTWCVLGIVVCFVGGCLTGCSSVEKLPEGSQAQVSGFGVLVDPQPVLGPPLAIGSMTAILNTPTPSDSGPNLNRYEVTAPGVHSRSTVAAGPVGDELQKAGGADAIRALVSPADAPPIPVRAPEP